MLLPWLNMSRHLLDLLFTHSAFSAQVETPQRVTGIVENVPVDMSNYDGK